MSMLLVRSEDDGKRGAIRDLLVLLVVEVELVSMSRAVVVLGLWLLLLMMVDLPLLLLLVVFLTGDDGALVVVVVLRQLFFGRAKGDDGSWRKAVGLGATGCLGKLSSTLRAEVW